MGTIDPHVTPYRVVVGIDFTTACDYALDEALRITWNADDDELHLVHVIKEKDSGRANHMSRDERLVTDAYTRLRQLVLEHGGRLNAKQWSQQVYYHVRLGDPADAIQQVAVDIDADIVVVGTHGRRGVEKFLLGSVAEKLLKEARVPLLVARPKNFDGLEKTAQIEPPKPGVNVHATRHDLVFSSELLTFPKRPSHISGLL